MQRQSFLASNVYAGQHPKPQHWVPTPKGNPYTYISVGHPVVLKEHYRNIKLVQETSAVVSINGDVGRFQNGQNVIRKTKGLLQASFVTRAVDQNWIKTSGPYANSLCRKIKISSITHWSTEATLYYLFAPRFGSDETIFQCFW